MIRQNKNERLFECRVLRRPLVGTALAVAVGMVVAATGIFSFHFLWSTALLLLVLTGLFFRTRGSVPLLFSCIALVGACRFVAVSDALDPHLPLGSAQVVGQIVSPPEFHAYRSGTHGAWNLVVACEGMKYKGHWTKQRGRIPVRISGAASSDPFQQGAKMYFSGTLRRPAFPGGDPVELAVSSGSDWKILRAPSSFSPTRWGQSLRATAAQTLSNGLDPYPDQLAIYQALLLGYRHAIPPEIYRHFQRTGTLHIFAISGLHVGIVGLLIVVVLKTLGLPYDRWGYGLLPLLLGYVMITGMKSSALRAFTMAAVYFIAPLFRRKPDVPTSIAFAACLLLFLQPMQIRSAGFLYSFTVVSFIVMAFSAVPKAFIYQGQGMPRAVRSYLVSLVITSLAAVIASVPLTALFFGTYSTVALLANLAVVPFTFCIVLSGWLAIVIPSCSELFNYAALVFINGQLVVVEVLGGWPRAFGLAPAPPLTALLFWYMGWIGWFTARQRGMALVFVLLAMATALIPRWI